jgi:hypothetical protein
VSFWVMRMPSFFLQAVPATSYYHILPISTATGNHMQTIQTDFLRTRTFPQSL